MKYVRKLSLLTLLVLLVALLAACGDNEPCTHDFSKWKEKTAATCTKEGNEVRTCKDCGEKETRAIEAIGHAYSKWEQTEAGTCATPCKESRKCKNCGDTQTQETAMTEYEADQVYEMSKDSVGEIQTFDKKGNALALGTGFVYAKDGTIITNFHVIEGAYSAKFLLGGSTYSVNQILAYDRDIDLAVLKVNATDLKALKLCDKEHAVGKSVYAFGSSQGLTDTFSRGIITANRALDGVQYVQHDSAISSGNSGGPLINSFGEVIGINTWTVRDSQNLNFAIAVKELENLNFDTPLTFAQLYDLEFNPYARLKNYILQNGTYDAQDQDYGLYLGSNKSGNYTYSRYAYYDVVDDEIAMYLIVGDMCFVLYIADVSTTYEWLCFDEDDYYMAGSVRAASFTTTSSLGYSATNLPTTSLKNSMQSLATSLARILLTSMETDLSSAGVTAADFGFIYF